MSLSEKIMTQRKAHGWSQEDLADQLGISRQSVSKWEAAASVPDLDKIIRMSQLFGVTTDYLLTDEEQLLRETVPPAGRVMTRDEAETYLAMAQRCAKPMAWTIFALILSPTLLLLLGALAECRPHVITDNMAGGLGVAFLLLIVAAAVAALIRFGTDLGRFSFLEEEQFHLQTGIAPRVRQLQEQFSNTYRGCISAGVVLCIVSVIPLMIAAAFQASDLIYIICVDVLLLFIACGVWLFVWSGMIHGSHQKLLQEGDYTPEEKEKNKRYGPLAACYWLTVTAIYLAISLTTRHWDRTWILWPCAGVLFAAIMAILQTRKQK